MRIPFAARNVARTVGLFLVVAPFGSSATTRADTTRLKTDQGVFLVESTDRSVVRLEGMELVVARPGGEEVRLKLNPADAAASGLIATIRRDGAIVVSIRRLATAPPPLVLGGPGRTTLNPRSLARAWSLAMTPDGKTLVSGHQGSIRVWDPSTLLERYASPIDRTGRRVAITPDGSTIASAEFTYVDGKAIGNVVIRDGKTGKVIRSSKPVEAVHGVAIDRSGKVVVSSSWSETSLRVWDVETGDQVGTLKGHTGSIMTIAFSPDGQTLASAGDDTVRLWDVDTGEVRRVLRGHRGMVESVAFSADGKTLASGGFDDDARVWDVETGKLLATLEHDHPVLSVALTPDGKTVATASARWGDGFYGAAPAKVKTWDVATGKPLATLPDQAEQVFAMLFAIDGRSLFTASLAGDVTRWDLSKFTGAQPAP